MLKLDSAFGNAGTAAECASGSATPTKTAPGPCETARPPGHAARTTQTDPLTAAECADFERKLGRLKELEAHWYEGNQLLLEIRDQRLYREHYLDFDTFCRQELGMGKSNYNRRLQTGQVAQLLATNVAKPEREAHVRPLLRLNAGDRQVEAYQRAIELAKDAKKPLTAVFVTRAVRELKQAERPPGPETPSGPSKPELITQISRALTRDLEQLTPEQLMTFDKACREFKAAWLQALPSEPPTADQAQSTEETDER